ncbi:MAG: type III pantothenate kinase [Dehalococcoidia bacterium]|nr:type III pantothenate kinase [Dehalococcoidia bacterium]
MLLTIDIGNTHINLGVFDGQTLKATWRMASDARRQSDEYHATIHTLLALKGIEPKHINGVALCSVVPPLTSVFEEMSKSAFNTTPVTVSVGIKTGLRVLYENPRDVGADRVADAVAAVNLYGPPVINVDFSTALVFDGVTRDGDYLGGAIVPGIGLAAEALFTNTSQLRRVELVRPKSVVGRNTVASIQAGLIYGYVSLVEGMVKRFRDELGADAKVIATGGQAAIIAKETTIFDAVNPDLTLIGLRMIYEMNR